MEQAEKYRQLAAECLSIAERMSLKADRARLMEMAERWSEMARKADSDGAGEAESC
jgi:hypothetical protein